MSQEYEKPNVLKYKLLYTCIILFVYELGRNIPLYGVDVRAGASGGLSAEDILIQAVSGDAYGSSVFAIGIFPYMIASIIVQIVMAIWNAVSDTRVSRKKVGRLSAAVTLFIAIFQAFSLVQRTEFKAGYEFIWPVAMTELVAGAMLILWMIHRLTKYGLGGGMTLGLANITSRISATLFGHSARELAFPLAIAAGMMLVVMVMENAEMRIPVQRISIQNIYADKNYMAIKLNPSGVMPMMFTTVVFMLPRMAVSFLAIFFPENPNVAWWQENLSLDKPFGIAAYVACLYLLTFFLALTFISPKDITEQFLKSGDSIVGLHAGRDTRRYLRRVMCCICFFSATVMGTCLAAPLVLQMRGILDSSLATLPTTVMMLAGLGCSFIREVDSVRKYDLYRPVV